MSVGGNVMIHPTADVQTDRIGAGTRIWQHVVILPETIIGRNCNICCNVLIEGGVVMGDNVTVKPGVMVSERMVVEDDVFIGANAAFPNDRHPRSGNRGYLCEPPVLRKGASIGACAVVMPGVTVGEGAMVGAGAVVTHDVAPGATVAGVPARPVGERRAFAGE